MNEVSKVELFKDFVRHNSFLITYIKNGEKSWQEMFEIYDLYGEDEGVWNKFLENKKEEKSSNNKSNNYFDELVKMAKNIDINKVQEGISSLQKTLGLLGDLFSSKNQGNENKNYQPRPLYRRFDD